MEVIPQATLQQEPGIGLSGVPVSYKRGLSNYMELETFRS
jgi:hypothetical protein